MSFDFDEPVDRSGTSSTKYEKYAGSDVLPLWVADMDFRSPPAVIEALVARSRHGVFGYVDTPPRLVDLIQARLAERYDWHVAADDLVFLPGVVPALNLACRAFAAPDEAVITLMPIYPPFQKAPYFAGRERIEVPAARDGNGWQVDLDALAEAAARPEARLLLLCNPWNPVGRVMDDAELAGIAEICERHDVLICSDEIHCDLLFDGARHVPTATLGRETAARTVTLMAPSKTFNLAGFGGSFAVIEDPGIRRTFTRAKRGIIANVNIMAYESMIACYEHGEPWYRELIAYLQGNRDYLAGALAGVPGISMNEVEATYLAWLDVSALGLDDPIGFFEAAGLGLSDGASFGDDRFMRLNFGCPRARLVDAVGRLEQAAHRAGC